MAQGSMCLFGHSSAPQVGEQTVDMTKMIAQERLETVERKLVEEMVTEREMRIREAGDLRSAIESLHEHIEHLKLDTGTTLDALERKLAHELEEGQAPAKSALKSVLSDFESCGNQRDEARTHQFEYVFARFDELLSDFIKHQEYIDKSKEFQEGTRTTLKALDQRVGVETAARFDTVH